MTSSEYRFENHSIKPMVIQNDDGRYQGIVLVVPGQGGSGEPDRLCVPDTTSSYSEALDEAKALAHKVFADKAFYFRRQ